MFAGKGTVNARRTAGLLALTAASALLLYCIRSPAVIYADEAAAADEIVKDEVFTDTADGMLTASERSAAKDIILSDDKADSSAEYAVSAVGTKLLSQAAAILNELKAMPDENEFDLSSGYLRSAAAYEELSALFDEADAAYEGGSLEETEYAYIIEQLNAIGEELMEEFARFGYDPYAVEMATAVYPDSSSISRYVPEYEWSASYNGSNIILNFSISITLTNRRLHTIYVGGSGELLKVDAYGYNHATTDPVKGAQYFVSNFGTVTLSSLDMGTRATKAAGTITITNPKGFKSWYESGDRKLWFKSYSDTGEDVNYYPDGTTGMNPTVIGNAAAAITNGTCSHQYSWSAVDGSTHKKACSSCGYIASTGAHNSSTSDTTSKKGYTISKCSVCSYSMSTKANTYSVTLNAGTGNSADNITVNAVYDSAMPAITAPKRNGYTFAGFYSGENGSGTQYYNASGKSTHKFDIAQNATLYALWNRNCEITVSDTVCNEFGIRGV